MAQKKMPSAAMKKLMAQDMQLDAKLGKYDTADAHKGKPKRKKK